MNRNEKLKRRKYNIKMRSKICTFDNPSLLEICVAVAPGEDLSFLDTLQQVCEASENGVGLAASQVGILKRAIFIFNDRKNGYFMINPVITNQSVDTEEAIEGCLSYPGYEKKIARSKKITVEYFTEKWEKVIREVEGFEARIILHECEHLDGINIWNK